MHDKDTEGETKSSLSAAAYLTLRGEVIWVQTDRKKACPAALSFLAKYERVVRLWKQAYRWI